MAKEEKKRGRTYSFWGVNIKIISGEKKGEQRYYDIMHKLFTDDITKPVGSDIAITLRSQIAEKFKFNGSEKDVLYGFVTRYTILDGKLWYNKKTKDYVDPGLNEEIYPNGFEAEYIFIPAVHRFYIATQQKISLKMVTSYLHQAIREIIGVHEDFSLHVMQSQNTIEEILSSTQLSDLTVDVTYTNDDVGDKAQEAMDKILKDNYIGELKATLKPDAHGRLNTNKTFVRGLLELAKDNGTAEANIIDATGKKKKIRTAKFPEIFKIKTSPTENILQKILSFVMTEYRNDARPN